MWNISYNYKKYVEYHDGNLKLKNISQTNTNIYQLQDYLQRLNFEIKE